MRSAKGIVNIHISKRGKICGKPPGIRFLSFMETHIFKKLNGTFEQLFQPCPYRLYRTDWVKVRDKNLMRLVLKKPYERGQRSAYPEIIRYPAVCYRHIKIASYKHTLSSHARVFYGRQFMIQLHRLRALLLRNARRANSDPQLKIRPPVLLREIPEHLLNQRNRRIKSESSRLFFLKTLCSAFSQ